ncbi:hypothetical protein FSARC_7406 [Fusarium sarcochroum]|uniref:Uncharacterized protein n=1 Tax=Fusarium sarcochroum TaxID=1208366 RepID=A0A8H4X8A4_9HYPO|nr:hypothetical protein FSARC_7406 [Fusarium sarcochroum]
MAPTAKTPVALILLEMAISTTAVVLFSLEYPASFRSRLWENGGEEGWNSNPNQRIYFYANHREPPEVPLLWSQRLSTSNLAIAILGFVVFIARSAMSHLRYLPPYVNIIYDMILLSLWAVSLASQTSGDFSDPKHPSPHPWYLTRGCAAAWDRNRGYCHIALASFAVSVIAATLYGTRLIREVLLIGYERGQRHEHKLNRFMVDDEMVESTEGTYTDDERVTVAGLTVKEDRYSQALSPVLAFFPSDSDNHW